MKLLAKQINSIIENNQSLRLELEKFNGYEIAIELLGLNTGFVINIIDERVFLAKLDPKLSYQATVSASVLDFMYMMKNKDKKDFVMPKNVKISGDGLKATKFLAFLGGFNIDWESYLASYFGDAPAHVINNIVDSGVKLFASLLDNTKYNVADFLTDEADILPTEYQVDEFCRDVTKLNDRVSRLEARVNNILNKEGLCEQS